MSLYNYVQNPISRKGKIFQKWEADRWMPWCAPANERYGDLNRIRCGQRWDQLFRTVFWAAKRQLFQFIGRECLIASCFGGIGFKDNNQRSVCFRLARYGRKNAIAA
jgi:hypothetical protein